MADCLYCDDTGLWPPRGVGCDDVFPEPCPEGCDPDDDTDDDEADQ